MKRVTFKTPFANDKEAFDKVPNVLKEDKNVFEMTDGNKTYQMRWEGSLTEGKAVALIGKDAKLISEDKKHQMHLIGYKSEDTLGAIKGEKRIDENDMFKALMGKVSVKKKQ